jgi:hypothetical protein
LNRTQRDVFNNIFVQMEQVPGVKFVAVKQANELREGGNLLWGMKDGPMLKQDPFAKFRASALFVESRKIYAPGWTTQDRIADPRFVNGLDDLRLQAESPAVNGGQPIPGDWPDPLRMKDAGGPDIGALPLGAKTWGVGVDGRLSLFSGDQTK